MSIRVIFRNERPLAVRLRKIVSRINDFVTEYGSRYFSLRMAIRNTRTNNFHIVSLSGTFIFDQYLLIVNCYLLIFAQ